MSNKNNFPFMEQATQWFLKYQRNKNKQKTEKDKFTIINFSNTTRKIAYLKDIDEIIKLEFKYGAGTNFLNAFQEAKKCIDDRKKNLNEIPYIIFITDGNDDNYKKCIPLLQQMYKECEDKQSSLYTFVIGLGDDINTSVLEEIARAGNGDQIERTIQNEVIQCLYYQKNGNELEKNFKSINKGICLNSLKTLCEKNMEDKLIFINNQEKRIKDNHNKYLEQRQEVYNLYSQILEKTEENSKNGKQKYDFTQEIQQQNDELQRVGEVLKQCKEEQQEISDERDTFIMELSIIEKILDEKEIIIKKQKLEDLREQQIKLIGNEQEGTFNSLNKEEKKHYQDAANVISQLYFQQFHWRSQLKLMIENISKQVNNIIEFINNSINYSSMEKNSIYKLFIEDLISKKKYNPEIEFQDILSNLLNSKKIYQQEFIEDLAHRYKGVQEILGEQYLQKPKIGENREQFSERQAQENYEFYKQCLETLENKCRDDKTKDLEEKLLDFEPEIKNVKTEINILIDEQKNEILEITNEFQSNLQQKIQELEETQNEQLNSIEQELAALKTESSNNQAQKEKEILKRRETIKKNNENTKKIMQQGIARELGIKQKEIKKQYEEKQSRKNKEKQDLESKKTKIEAEIRQAKNNNKQLKDMKSAFEDIRFFFATQLDLYLSEIPKQNLRNEFESLCTLNIDSLVQNYNQISGYIDITSQAGYSRCGKTWKYSLTSQGTQSLAIKDGQ